MTTTYPASSIHEPMAMTAHLEELRNRILWCVGALILTFGGALWLAPKLIGWMVSLTTTVSPETAFHLVQITPGETLFASLKLAMVMGAVMASPVVLYHTCRFVLPALTQNERWPLLGVVLGGAVVFGVGAVFAAVVVIPTALAFLLDFSKGVAENWISVDRYVGFCLSLILLVGLVAEFPLVLVFLAKLGWITSGQLATRWREACLGLLLAGAILTPSQDPLSMLLVAGLLGVLYILSWGVICLMEQTRKPVQP